MLFHSSLTIFVRKVDTEINSNSKLATHETDLEVWCQYHLRPQFLIKKKFIETILIFRENVTHMFLPH